MKTKIITPNLIPLLFALCLAAPVVAGPYEDGLAAATSGDYATALRIWKPLADQGNAKAQYALGLMYTKGEGVPQDFAEAAKWSRKAADQGHAFAQSNLGFMYSNGQGVPRDDAEAMKWFRKAADQGDASSQFNIGFMYGNGRGVKKDDAEAVKWYRKAAEQGDASSQFNLGIMYAYGEGVPQDDAEAVKWYRKAADQGNIKAQYNLGNMYYNGEGVAQDHILAHMWWNLSAAGASDKGTRDSANKNRDIVAKKITPVQLAEAQRLAREWKKVKQPEPAVAAVRPTPQAAPQPASSAASRTFSIGDAGPAGGLVFYDKGSFSDGWRYLEAAPSDQSTGVQWFKGNFVNTGASGTAVGTGRANTAAIVSAQGVGTYAAKICADLSLGGFSDWFLPSQDELDLMYKNLHLAGRGGFASACYWSSSENHVNYVWRQDFNDGEQDNYGSKDFEDLVRAVRAF